MSTVTLNPALSSQKWNLGSGSFAGRLSVVKDASSDNLTITLGATGDADLAKVASAFGTYLSSDDRKTDSLGQKLIVAHNAGEIFGKIANHNRKIYDNSTITVFHVILAILTLGIFSLRAQYTIDMPKVDLLSGLDFTALDAKQKATLATELSMREFFLLSKPRRDEFLKAVESAMVVPQAITNQLTATNREFPAYLASMKKLPLEMQAAIPLSFFVALSGMKSQSSIDAETLKLVEMSNADFLKAPISDLLNLPEQGIRIVAARLKNLSKQCEAAAPHTKLDDATLANFARFSPQEVLELLAVLPKGSVSVAHTLFPRDVLFKAIFSKEVIADGVAVANKQGTDANGARTGALIGNAKLALEGFFADHPFSRVDRSVPKGGGSAASSSSAITPMRVRQEFVDVIKAGGARAKIHIENEALQNELGAYFTDFLEVADVASLFRAFSSNSPGVQAFFQCLESKVLVKCDWGALEAREIANVLWDYNQDRLSNTNMLCAETILEKLVAGKNEVEVWIPELLSDGMWSGFISFCLEHHNGQLSVEAQKALFSPSGIGTKGAQVLRDYHLRHWGLIPRPSQELLSKNGAFPKEFLELEANPKRNAGGGAGGAAGGGDGKGGNSSNSAASTSTSGTGGGKASSNVPPAQAAASAAAANSSGSNKVTGTLVRPAFSENRFALLDVIGPGNSTAAASSSSSSSSTSTTNGGAASTQTGVAGKEAASSSSSTSAGNLHDPFVAQQQSSTDGTGRHGSSEETRTNETSNGSNQTGGPKGDLFSNLRRQGSEFLEKAKTVATGLGMGSGSNSGAVSGNMSALDTTTATTTTSSSAAAGSSSSSNSNVPGRTSPPKDGGVTRTNTAAAAPNSKKPANNNNNGHHHAKKKQNENEKK